MGIISKLTNAGEQEPGGPTAMAHELVRSLLRREDVTRIVQILRLLVFGDTEKPASR
jgi:hypothetical protein